MVIRRALLAIAVTVALIPANGFAKDHRAYRRLPDATCTPRALKQGDSLVIKLPAEHGRELIAVDPVGDEIHLTYDRQASEREIPTLIDEAEFSSLRRLDLKVDTVEGYNYYDFKLGPVFKANGRYRFVLILLDQYGFFDVVPLCSVNYRNPKDRRPPPKPRETYFGNDPY